MATYLLVLPLLFYNVFITACYLEYKKLYYPTDAQIYNS